MARNKTLQNNRLISMAKNAVRGALANKDGDTLDVISRVILELPCQHLARFADWIDSYAAKRCRIYPPPRISSFTDLWPQSFLRTGDLATQLSWLSRLLFRHRSTIQGFLSQRDCFDAAVLSGSYEMALNILDAIEIDHGLSIWLIEARIAVLHRFKGLEAQKSYARSIHDAAPRSVPAYIAHYTSQRNEDSTSFDRYAARVSDEIDKQSIRDETKVYLRDRLIFNRLAELDEGTLCTSLSIASGVSITDAYEAYVEVLQVLARGNEIEPMLGSAARFLTGFCPNDWRLHKLRAIVGNDFTGLQPRSLDADDALLRGQFNTAIDIATNDARCNALDVDALAIVAEASALSDRVPERNSLSALQHEVLTLLTTLYARRGAVPKAASDISKLGSNLRAVRVLGAVTGYAARLWHDQSQIGDSKARCIFYSSSLLTPCHWPLLPPEGAKRLLAHCNKTVGEYQVTRVAIRHFEKQSPFIDGLNSNRVSALSIEAALYHGELSQALTHARRLSQSAEDAWRRLAAKTELYCLLATEQIDDVIKVAASYCCRDENLRYAVPLRAVLSGKRWKDLKHLAAEIALPILLDLYWHTIDEAEHDTTRRIAYDEFLKAHHCQRPSELASLIDRFDRDQLVFFLANICVPEVMDVAFDVFEHSRAIEEERINICALLTDLDSSHSSQYADELKLRTQFLSIQDGLRDVDQSRVHVNVEAVSRWAAKEFTESFARYKDLLRSGIGFGSPEDFQKAMRLVSEGNELSAKELLHYPEQESDSLLIDIFERIKSEYLTNSDHGLDAYLSMRVRHGSLSGHLRGPLEERRLIVSKVENSQKYRQNTELADVLRFTAPHEREHLFESFAEFSARYDAVIEDLTKHRLQIRTAEKPKGMFYLNIELYPLVLHFVRSRIQEDTSFDEFVATVFIGIESMIQQILLEVRKYILSSVKPEVEQAFEDLRSSLERVISLRSYLKANSIIADVIPAVQAAIDRVAEWFVPVQTQQGSVLRTVEQIVEIGIEATRRAHRGFSPRLEREIENIGVQSAAFLLEVTDILFTVLDNVYSHSGNRTSPWVKLRVWSEDVDGVRRTVRLRVESEVAPGTYDEASRLKLDRIKEQMVSGEYRKHVNLEGGTGLLKLKRFVSSDERQTLDFGFSGEESFFVEMGLVRPFGAPADRTMAGV